MSTDISSNFSYPVDFLEIRYRYRRRMLLASVLACFVPLTMARNAEYPSKTVRLVVGYPAGGSADQLARAVAERLSRRFEYPVIVENRPGANGNLAAEVVSRSAPDGYTLLVTAPGPVAVNEAVYRKLAFDPKTAFEPVTMLATAPLVLVVSASLPVNSFDELRSYLKSNPAKATFASQGIASSGHLAMELLKARTGIEAVHAPYRGSAPAIADLLAGHVLMMFDNTTSALPQIRAGKLRALAVAEAQRLTVLPQVPTVAELGVPGFEATPWFGIVAPAGTPSTVIHILNTEIRNILSDSMLREGFSRNGVELMGNSAENFATYIRRESEKWVGVVKKAGVNFLD